MAGKKTWGSPESALRMRGLIADIAKDAVESAIIYRKAIVDAIGPDSLTVHFPEEPGNTFVLQNLPAERPKAAGQTVDVLIRDQVNFSLYKVYGDVVLVGAATPDQFAPTAAPANVTATIGSDGTATVAWDALASATGYDVQTATDSAFTANLKTASTTTTQYLATGLVVGSSLYVRVRAKNVGGVGPWSTATNPGAPAAVAGIVLTSVNRSITATWTPQPTVTQYEVQRSKDSTFASGMVSQIVTSNQLVIHNLLEDEVWFFRVRGVSASGTGAWSTSSSVAVQTDSPAPDAPTGTTTLVLSAQLKQITATWDPITGADTYELQRSNSSSFVTGPVIEIIEGTQFIQTDLNPAQEYWFRVRGVNTAGPGPWSATVSKMVPLASEISDGVAPVNSPAVTVEPSLKMLTAKWPAQANGDLVTYEVHMSTTTNFTPGPTTKLGETTNTFWITTKTAAAADLVIGTTYFIRVIAKDRDGAAVAGAQGSGAPLGINLGEAGDVPGGMVKGDGAVPAKPAAPTIINGIGYLYVNWTRPASNDPIEYYEVHVSDVNASFAPDANTLSLVTGSLFGFVRKQGPGKANAALVYGTTYYVKIIAVDVDGVSPASDATSGITVQTNAADIAAGAVIATKIYSGAVMADRIQATNIATDAVTSRVIYSGTVMADRIQAANIATGIITAASAIIADAAITTAKIDTLQVTDAKIGSIGANKITTETLSATLTVSGIIRTSSGATRVEMNSGGIFAYSGGTNVFELNASNGNAYFRGNIYAVSGTFTGDISSSATITGGYLQTAATGRRVRIGDAVAQDHTGMGGGGVNVYYAGMAFYNTNGTIVGKVYGTDIGLALTGGLGYIDLGGTGTTVHGNGGNLYLGAGTDLEYSSVRTNWGTPLIGSNGGIYEYNGTYYRVYSPLNPPPTHSHDFAASSHSHNYADSSHSHNYALSAHDHGALYNYGSTSGSNGISTDGVYVRIHNASGSQFRANYGAQCNWTGSKTFVIDHPEDKFKFLVHAASEGPTADVHYRGEGKLVDGEVVIELPTYFESLTKKKGRTVTVTPILGCDAKCKVIEEGRDFVTPNLGVSRVVDGKFTVKFIGGWDHRCASFFWEVKAIRNDVAQFEVEPEKSDYKVHGDGPYTYLTPA